MDFVLKTYNITTGLSPWTPIGFLNVLHFIENRHEVVASCIVNFLLILKILKNYLFYQGKSEGDPVPQYLVPRGVWFAQDLGIKSHLKKYSFPRAHR
jgi:hypothetical protein